MSAPEKANKIGVVLADDHEIVRDGLRLLLEAEPDMEVVAEAGDVETTMRRVLAYKPAVLVLDVNMAGESSLSAIPQLLESSPETAVIVLTMQDEPVFARDALRSGAKGFVVKHAAGRELVEAIREAMRGGTYINPRLGARIAAEPPPAEGPPGGLTEREAEVLGLVALGFSGPEIAEKLVLSERTIETHRAHIQQKLGVTTRAELVRFALDNDLIER
ncbi:MAG TPA: response regulator transcription factor [Solirubrobacterales bacterium]|nr:response regulator transcription factor [Solirubrobacterales bacterium]